ncbi:MAG: 2-oxoglutarate and iron-dependent oxygenase domain-containing protein [Pseudohongiellaceae bacterium]
MSDSITRLSLTDLHRDPETFRQRLFEGLREHGFVILRDHPITRERLDQAYALARDFFALPTASKLRYDSGSGGARGFTAFGRENARGNPHSDLKEFWHIGPDVAPDSPYFGVYTDNVWPDEIPAFRPCFQALYLDMEQLGKIMLDALGQALKLDPDFFRDMVTDGQSVLRLLHYPEMEGLEAEGLEGLDTHKEGLDTHNAMRAAPHADINLLTLLVGATDSGLELYDRRGNWLPVESEPDEIVLDTGDMMSRLTNDVLPATVHRVVNSNDRDESRYSMPFFLHPHARASLDCLPQCVDRSGPRYAPITAGEFLQQRLREIGLVY